MIRFGIALLTGAAITFGLFFLMQLLIATGKGALSESKGGHIVDFVRVKKEERLERKKPKPKKPPKPEEPPPEVPQESKTTSLDATAEAVSIAPVPVMQADLNISSGFGGGFGTSDGDYMPIVKVAPVYPIAAQTRGIEGYVVISFTVTKSGSVKDPTVVEYHPSPIFNQAAMKAALKFKYKPRVVNGEAIEVLGVLNKIVFKIDN